VPLVEQKKLGRKSGEGLYAWKDGKVVKPPVDASVAPAPVDLEDRLILPMVNEAVAILREGIVADEELVDAGVIFGAGFAPFRGGLMRYARERGLAVVHGRLLELQSRYGARFSPDAGWPRLLEPR
jgi:3-hydroxyacyl-CoA dehydrogenase/enoyl-CoA hydratase/3-hydroxybutyryl-CoA epimerase